MRHMLLRRQREARAARAENRAAEQAVPDPVALEDMTGAQLKAELKARELPVSGKVDELRERLAQAIGNVQPATDDAGDETAGKDVDEVVDDVADAEADTSVEDPLGNADGEPDDEADEDPAA